MTIHLSGSVHNQPTPNIYIDAWLPGIRVASQYPLYTTTQVYHANQAATLDIVFIASLFEHTKSVFLSSQVPIIITIYEYLRRRKSITLAIILIHFLRTTPPPFPSQTTERSPILHVLMVCLVAVVLPILPILIYLDIRLPSGIFFAIKKEIISRPKLSY